VTDAPRPQPSGLALPLLLAGRFAAETGALVQSVAVGWTVYNRSSSALALGIVGLVQFLPMLVLTLPAGEWCDRFGPRRVLIAGLALQALCAAALVALMWSTVNGLLPFYGVLSVAGAARALSDPAAQALLPFVVDERRLPHAVALSSSLWQIAVIVGPVLGGFASALAPASAFALCGLSFVGAAVCVALLRERRVARTDPGLAGTLARVAAGARFVWSHRVLLGAISLDMFAVLLGGAAALLPIYARDILRVGPSGLGLLRSAPAVGACLVAIYQAHRPPRERVGRKVLAAVALFGLATLLFAFSKLFFLSLAALALVGAADMVSVNIRAALVQLGTPDVMRGRVSAVHMLFVGASNELGDFESGVLAALLGTVPAVALGGVAAVLLAGAWAILFPGLRKVDRLAIAAPP
jgi:MFS family permease